MCAWHVLESEQALGTCKHLGSPCTTVHNMITHHWMSTCKLSAMSVARHALTRCMHSQPPPPGQGAAAGLETRPVPAPSFSVFMARALCKAAHALARAGLPSSWGTAGGLWLVVGRAGSCAGGAGHGLCACLDGAVSLCACQGCMPCPAPPGLLAMACSYSATKSMACS